MDSGTIKTIALECFGLKKSEHVLIVCDDKLSDLARDFYEVIKNLSAECVLMQMPPRKMHGVEPPGEIACALKKADIAILLTNMSLSHTRARKEACAKYGTRMASLPGITKEILKRSIKLDYSALNRKANKIAKALTKGKGVQIYTDKGTSLKLSIRGRRGYVDNGLYVKAGAFGNLPAGEACIAPCEGTTNGTLVVDASAAIAGKVKRPVKIKIKNGFIQNMPLPKIKALIKPLGKPALNIAELGIGLNPKAKVTGNILEDEKAKNTAHLAIGANISFGGKVSCPCHLDFVFFNPRIFIDGKRLRI
ncbi:MAG: aminopeptidase [Candidatus Omnitrophica bacterium]|nr:aminopeptidase [Candidatus Omnitrophota bacterium]